MAWEMDNSATMKFIEDIRAGRVAAVRKAITRGPGTATRMTTLTMASSLAAAAWTRLCIRFVMTAIQFVL
jgi:hypothetical protein